MPIPLPLGPALQTFALPGGVGMIRREIRKVKGYAEEVELPEVELKAVVHPATGRDYDRLPEGLRTREIVIVFTNADLRCELEGHFPDTLVYRPGNDAEPKRYICYQSEDWSRQSCARHVRVLAYREPVKRR